MAEYLGNINTLPELRLSYPDKKPSIVRTRATENCDLFGSETTPSAGKLTIEDFIDNTPDPYMQNLAQKFNNFYDKTKNKIDATLPNVKKEIIKLANRKWAFLINPNPEPKPQFLINVAGLTPKMQKELLNLYDYAQKLGIKILVNDAARTPEQQKLVKGGAKCSAHMQGIAVDIHIADKTVEEAQPYLKKLAKYWEGRGHRWGGSFNDPWHFDLVPKGHVPICLNKTTKNKKTEGV